MSVKYDELQLLRTLIESRTPLDDQGGSPEQVILRVVTLLGNTPTGGNISWRDLFDLVADVYSDGVLWDFSEGDK